eukprot:4579284-Pyramimonas_sp.AAC.1
MGSSSRRGEEGIVEIGPPVRRAPRGTVDMLLGGSSPTQRARGARRSPATASQHSRFARAGRPAGPPGRSAPA